MRLFGGLLLSAALSLFLLSRLRREEESFLLLSALLSFTREVRQRISAFGTPLDEIVSHCNDPVLTKEGFLPLAREKGLSAAGAALRERGALPQALSSSLADFFASLGKGFQADEVQKCDMAERLLEKAREEALPALEKKRKLTRALILTGALFILIILW